MGARSSPEGYRVAVARYGLPVQMRAQAVRRCDRAGRRGRDGPGCSHVTGSKSTKDGKPRPCTFIAKLDEIANTVATADVHDPDTFKKTLDTAVRDYVTNVRELHAVAPIDLHDGLTRVEADVSSTASTPRSPIGCALDAYARARAVGSRTPRRRSPNGATTTTSVPTGCRPWRRFRPGRPGRPRPRRRRTADS